jgi:AbrB family looped-hinge helix DNA binding protein
MSLSTLKDKGQITLPSAIRKEIQAEKGDMFDFQVQQDNKILMTRKRVISASDRQISSREKKNLSKWIGAKPNVFKTAEEVDQFIRNQRNLWS